MIYKMTIIFIGHYWKLLNSLMCIIDDDLQLFVVTGVHLVLIIITRSDASFIVCQ